MLFGFCVTYKGTKKNKKFWREAALKMQMRGRGRGYAVRWVHIIFRAVFLVPVCRFNPNAYLCTAKHCNQLGEAHNVRSVRGYCTLQ